MDLKLLFFCLKYKFIRLSFPYNGLSVVFSLLETFICISFDSLFAEVNKSVGIWSMIGFIKFCFKFDFKPLWLQHNFDGAGGLNSSVAFSTSVFFSISNCEEEIKI